MFPTLVVGLMAVVVMVSGVVAYPALAGALGVPARRAGRSARSEKVSARATRSTLSSDSTAAWTAVPSMNTSLFRSNHLRGVSCATSTFCVAVGYFDNGFADQTLIEQYNGRVWTQVASPDTSQLQSNVLRDVSCASPAYCVAVGFYSNGFWDEPLVEAFGGAGWEIVTGEGDSVAGSQKLYGVSCAIQGNCALVGDSLANGAWRSLVGAFQAGTWSVSAGHQGILYGVSCVASNYCVAVGDRVELEAWQALIMTYDGTRWSLQAAPDTSASQANILRSVSCPSVSFCVAAGSVWSGILWQTLVDTWNGAVWSISLTPDTPFPDNDYLYGVSCSTPIYCVAVGAHVTHGLIETYHAGVWSITPSPDSSPASWDVFWGASCAHQGGCVATGTRGIFNGTVRQTFVERSGTPGAQGYWIALSNGAILGFGNGYSYGSATSIFQGASGGGGQFPIVGVARGPYALGYWEVASDGGIFALGDAKFYGSIGGAVLNAPVVGIAATPGGHGYWEVASDGGIFAFGSAKFYGSMGARHLDKPVVGIAATPGGHGYWEVASDGGIFAFGSAKFYGSTGGDRLYAKVTGIASTGS